MSRTWKDTKEFVLKKANQMRTIPGCIGGIPSWFKRMKRKAERAKLKDAMRNSKEPPRNRKNNEYDYY